MTHGIELPPSSDPERVGEGVAAEQVRLPDPERVSDGAPDGVQVHPTLLTETREPRSTSKQNRNIRLAPIFLKVVPIQ